VQITLEPRYRIFKTWFFLHVPVFPFPTLERDLPKLKYWVDASASLGIEKEKAGDCRYPKSGVRTRKTGFTLLASDFSLSTPSPFPS
tara:strand:- start:529 stop:789 length:261 start_codon:yes stop_codon:yes gene_type:complete